MVDYDVFERYVFDFRVRDEGTIWLVHPQTQRAKNWVEEYIQEDAQWFGNAFVVEHRYIADIIDGMVQDGLSVEGS